MKNKILILIITAITLFPSCESLVVEPTDFVATEFFYDSEENLNYGLNGVYDVLGSWNLWGGGNGLSGNADVADEMYFRSASVATGIWSYNYASSDNRILMIWMDLYKGIERANLILKYIDDVKDITEDRKNEIEGQVRVLRAWFQFALVRNFGDVPLKISATTSTYDVDIPRTPANEIYQFIYDDLVKAEGMLKPSTAYTTPGRICKEAAQGILAKVCLFWAGFPNYQTDKYADALYWSEKIINSGLHSLNPSYEQFFINLIQEKYDMQESIWEIEFYNPDITDYFEAGQIGVNVGISQNVLELGYGVGHYKVHQMHYNRYEEGDTRRDWAIAPYFYYYNANPLQKLDWGTNYYDRDVGKFRREYELTTSKSKNFSGINFPLLRYADVLLMAAEAENEVNGPTTKALDYINEVRARANASILESGMSQDEFRSILQDERSRELCFEATRRLDLIRWGIFVERMKELEVYVDETAPSNRVANASEAAKNVEFKHNYFPIPVSEVSINKMLDQTPGW